MAAFCAYLGAWMVFAVGALVNSVPLMQRRMTAALHFKASVVIGTLLQIGSALVITFRMGDRRLTPTSLELAGVLALAPLAAILFVWALLAVPRNAGAETLVSHGAYSRIRHPIYLAFLMMLIATGLLSSGPRLAASILLYLFGSELRIASEEEELIARFGAEYEQYRLRTRWRYLPGVR